MLDFTKEELQIIHRHSLDRLIEIAGGAAHLAKMLGEKPSTVSSWVARGRISKEGATKVSKHNTLKLKISAVELRPEIK